MPLGDVRGIGPITHVSVKADNGVRADNGRHRHSAPALDVRAKFRLCRTPNLHRFGKANAVGLAQGHLPGKRSRSLNRGIITHLFNRLVCCRLGSFWLVAVKELTEGGLTGVPFEAGS